jgi:fructose-1,6-bisphosphatase/sedoheptulose 1,7-bisphosphatase-like protein
VVLALKIEHRGSEPRNVGRLEGLKKQRNVFFSGVSVTNAALLTP